MNVVADLLGLFKKLRDFREVLAEEGGEAAEVMHAHDAKVFKGFAEDIGNGAVACPADAHHYQHLRDVAGGNPMFAQEPEHQFIVSSYFEACIK